MDKPFKTIDEQFNKLTDRGLAFKDERKAKQYLLFNNYYNVINQHGRFFRISDKEEYVAGSTFEEIIAVREFDRTIKSILLNAVLDVENYFKSALSYEFSEAYKNDIKPYLNISSYETRDQVALSQFLSDMNKIINKYAKATDMNSIKHYSLHHDDIPFWVFSDYMSFGQLVTMYHLLPKSIQNKVAKDFSVLANENMSLPGSTIRINPTTLYRVISSIKDLRNTLAHNNMMFYYQSHNNLPYYSVIHSPLMIDKSAARQSVYDIFIILQLFLSKDKHTKYCQELKDCAANLAKSINSIDCNTVLISLGFPKDFYK